MSDVFHCNDKVIWLQPSWKQINVFGCKLFVLPKDPICIFLFLQNNEDIISDPHQDDEDEFSEFGGFEARLIYTVLC